MGRYRVRDLEFPENRVRWFAEEFPTARKLLLFNGPGLREGYMKALMHNKRFPISIPRPLQFEDDSGASLTINTYGDDSSKGVAFHIRKGNNRELHIALPDDLVPKVIKRVAALGRNEAVQFEDGQGDRLEISRSETEQSNEITGFTIATKINRSISIELPMAVVPEILHYIEWLTHRASVPPPFLSRIRRAHSYCGPEAKIEDILNDLASLPDDEVARTLMNLAYRDRVDLAVRLLERLRSSGRFAESLESLGHSYYAWEKPSDVSWNDLVQWASIELDTPPAAVSSFSNREPLGEYQAYDYIACFESAFGDSFEHLPFDTMDFRAEQAALRRLTENLNYYFESVTYPQAGPDQIVPYFTEKDQWTRGLGFDYIMFSYTPPLWYQEARKYLLFAHKICFEDPLTQIIEPITSNINNRSYHHDGVYYQGGFVHSSHLDLLRLMLVNAKKMARLIRAGIVIPHCLLNDRIPNFSEGEYSSMRFRDEQSYFVMERFAQTLGGLISEGHVDSFGLPDYLKEKAKELRGYWEDLDWLVEFFDELSIHDENLSRDDPIRSWPDHLYRIALHSRYFESHDLGYSLHFLHPQGYKIYSILEAADLAFSRLQGNLEVAIDPIRYASTLGHDAILVNQLDPALQPKLNELTDDDLASIRLDEDLFEEWRHTLRDILKRIRSYEAATGGEGGDVVAEEIRQSFRTWQESRKKRLKGSVLGTFFEAGTSAIVSVVTSGLILGTVPKPPSLLLGAACGVLKGAGKIFGWRKKGDLVKRHFLSVA